MGEDNTLFLCYILAVVVFILIIISIGILLGTELFNSYSKQYYVEYETNSSYNNCIKTEDKIFCEIEVNDYE